MDLSYIKIHARKEVIVSGANKNYFDLSSTERGKEMENINLEFLESHWMYR